MVGKQPLLTVIVVSLLAGCFAGALYFPLATHELVREDTQLGSSPHEPHVSMGGLTNEGNQTMDYEFRVADTNASIYVMSPENWNETKNGTLTYDPSLSHVVLTNTYVVIELPSNYTAWVYAGETTDGSVFIVERTTQTPDGWEVLLAGVLGFLACIVALSIVAAIRNWDG